MVLFFRSDGRYFFIGRNVDCEASFLREPVGYRLETIGVEERCDAGNIIRVEIARKRIRVFDESLYGE